MADETDPRVEQYGGMRAYYPGMAELLYDGLARAVSFPFQVAGDSPYHARQVGENVRDMVKVPMEFIYGPQETEETLRDLSKRGLHADKETALDLGSLALNLLPAVAGARKPIKAAAGGLGDLLAKYGIEAAEAVGGPLPAARGFAKGGRVALETAIDAGKAAYDRLAELAERYGLKAGADDPHLISNAYPSEAAVRKGLAPDPYTSLVLQNTDRMRAAPDTFAGNMDLLTQEGYLADLVGRSPDEIAHHAVRRSADNLKFIINDLMDPGDVDKARQWYETAHRLSGEKAMGVGLPPQAGFGTTAVLSPQNEWDNNVANAFRMMDMHAQGFDLSSAERRRALDRIAEMQMEGKDNALTQADRGTLERIFSEPMEALADKGDRRMKVVLADAARNDPRIRRVLSSGEFGDPAGWVKWGNAGEIDKALSVLRDPSLENINAQMTGGGGKVPSFYNNIAAPYSRVPISTIDTHSAGASALFPGGGSDTVVYRAMGLNPKTGLPPAAFNSKPAGTQGMYGIFSDAHKLAGRELGMLPREVQSATWEGVRGLWGGSAKRAGTLKADIDRIWREAPSPDAARYAIAERLGRGLRRSYAVKK